MTKPTSDGEGARRTGGGSADGRLRARLARLKHLWAAARAERVFKRAYSRLTPAEVDHVASTMDSHVARVLQGGPGRAADLPFPRALIELAFIKALREWPEGDRLESLKVSYASIDDLMLDDADYRVLVDRGGVTREPRASSRSVEAVRTALGEKARRRREVVEAIVAQRSRPYEPILHVLLILLGVWGLAWAGCLVAWGSVGFDGGLAGLLGGIVYQSGEAAGRFAGSLVSAGVVVFLLAPLFMMGAALAYLIFVYPFPSVRTGIVTLWRRVSGIR